jgi:4a-hydroxytetrahydrobiopterin dehydratase
MKTPPSPLDPAEIARALAGLPGWRHERESLAKDFAFADFRSALAWMLRAGFEAEELNHHPEWTNVYRTVAVRLNTHSAGGRVTALDVELAKRLERLAKAAGENGGASSS